MEVEMNSQGNIKESNISKKTGKAKVAHGGYRPNAGRKRRMEEDELIAKLSPMADKAFKMLEQKVLDGDMKALQIFMQYFIGLPTQKIESKIEGNLNQVSVEVVKPSMEKVA
jgi:hypothetical protein